jgi:hypothetical protein
MNDQPNLRSIIANTEVDAFLAGAQRYIEQQRKRLLDTQLDYTSRRASLLAQLSDLDAEFQRRMPELEAQLQRMLAMRDSSQSPFG